MPGKDKPIKATVDQLLALFDARDVSGSKDPAIENQLAKLKKFLDTAKANGKETISQNEYNKAFGYRQQMRTNVGPVATSSEHMANEISDAAILSPDFYDSLHDDRNQKKVFSASEEGWGNPTIDSHLFSELGEIFYDNGGKTKAYSDIGYGMFSYTSDTSMKLLTKLNDVKGELGLDNGGVTLSTLEQKMGTEDFNLLLKKGKEESKKTGGARMSGSTYNERVLQGFAHEVYECQQKGAPLAIEKSRDALKRGLYKPSEGKVKNKSEFEAKQQDTIFLSGVTRSQRYIDEQKTLDEIKTAYEDVQNECSPEEISEIYQKEIEDKGLTYTKMMFGAVKNTYTDTRL